MKPLTKILAILLLTLNFSSCCPVFYGYDGYYSDYYPGYRRHPRYLVVRDRYETRRSYRHEHRYQNSNHNGDRGHNQEGNRRENR